MPDTGLPGTCSYNRIVIALLLATICSPSWIAWSLDSANLHGRNHYRADYQIYPHWLLSVPIKNQLRHVCPLRIPRYIKTWGRGTVGRRAPHFELCAGSWRQIPPLVDTRQVGNGSSVNIVAARRMTYTLGKGGVFFFQHLSIEPVGNKRCYYANGYHWVKCHRWATPW